VVRNIPARFSQEKLLEVWPPDGSYNLFYVPYSFTRQRRWHGQKLSHIGSSTRLDINVAAFQGLVGNLKHLKASNIRRINNQRFLPMAFKGTKKLDFKALLDLEDFEGIDDERLESLVIE